MYEKEIERIRREKEAAIAEMEIHHKENMEQIEEKYKRDMEKISLCRKELISAVESSNKDAIKDIIMKMVITM